MGLIEAKPEEFRFLWVTDFPLFSPDLHDKSDPGQEGIAGIRSTHHPFTAPQIEDLEHLINDPSKVEPLKVKGQHYDLVVNGVELGGGSVRIHDADLQHYVLKEILKVCPPIYGLIGSSRINEYEISTISSRRWQADVLPTRVLHWVFPCQNYINSRIRPNGSAIGRN